MLLQIEEGASQSRLRIFVQKNSNEIVDVLIFHVFGEFQRVFQDLLIDLKRILGIFSKRHKSCHEFIQNDTQRPKIDGEGVSFTCQGFRSHVIWGSDHGKSFLSPIQFLASTQIY